MDALGKAASRIRGQLGESLATVQKFDIPLAQATTSSLEALKAYSLGLKANNEKGFTAALSYYQHAIQLDPNFAMGYRAVGAAYGSLGEMGRANDYYTRAFQLREHASEREALMITASYYQNVSGELDKAAQTFQQIIDSYPRDPVAFSTLGTVYAAQGQYEKASESTRQSVRLAPERVVGYGNLVTSALLYKISMRHGRSSIRRKRENWIIRCSTMLFMLWLRSRKTQPPWRSSNSGLPVSPTTRTGGLHSLLTPRRMAVIWPSRAS